MATYSSIKKQGFAITKGITENIFTLLPNNVGYPPVQGFFEPDGFPGGFDTLIETNFRTAYGADTNTYPSSAMLLNFDEIELVHETNDTLLHSNYPPLSGVVNLNALESGFSKNTFISTNIISSVGSSSVSEPVSTSINNQYEMLLDQQDNFYNNTNYLETFAPPII